MAYYLDPKNDLTFKRIFGEHPELLKSFLNAVMPFPTDRHIVELEYLLPEQVPDNPGKKNSIVDVKCRDNRKRQFIIEMQMDWDEVFMNRIVFNAGKAYVKQLIRGDAYHLLQPVYTLAIMNDTFDYKTEQFYHHYQIINPNNTDEIIHGLEFVLVELEKFHPSTVSERKLMILWLRFLKEVNEGMTELPPELAANEQIRQAAELCRESAFTPEERVVYDKYWDIIRTDIAVRESVRMKGEAKGITIGLEKGEAIGLKKGRAEERKSMVRNAYQAGYSIEIIASFTGLTADEVIKIVNLR